MRSSIILTTGLIITLFTSCKEQVEFQSNECKKQPSFVRSIGFNPGRSAFSTSEKKTMGLVLVELQNQGEPRRYQHPSWRMGGWMGPIQLDQFGNCFVGPVPVVNVYNNPTAKQNTLYKVDALSGIMNVFVELPVTDSVHAVNPYGILGLAYLCETNTLYVSSVMSSDRTREKGVVYALDASTGEILDKIPGIDILGMGISYAPGTRTLYMGSARTSNIYAVTLTDKGKFSSKPQVVLSLANLGPRGDDKVRRMRYNQYGAMLIYGVEFNFNLTAPTEKQETVYEFSWDDTEGKWVFVK
ncbi:MAG: hypothetical protein QM725_16885 [Lacibacter sp.]